MQLVASTPRLLGEFTHNGKITLLYGDVALTRLALFGITRLAVEGREVWVVDGANSFDAYFAARLARGWGYAPETILSGVRLSRAFTCYQVHDLITRKLMLDHTTPATIFCLGLLETFYDEDVPLPDAVRLVKSIITRLTDLAHSGHTILITMRELHEAFRERSVLSDLLTASTDRMSHIAAPVGDDTRPSTQPWLIAK